MEIWKQLDRIPGYEVSDHGRVRSLKSGKPKLMSIVENNKGYYQCCLFHNKKRITAYAHRLVAEAFIPTGLDIHSAEVNHKDKNRKNNHISNLEWTSYLENQKHKLNPTRYFLFQRLENLTNNMSDQELETFITSAEKSIK